MRKDRSQTPTAEPDKAKGIVTVSLEYALCKWCGWHIQRPTGLEDWHHSSGGIKCRGGLR